MKCDELETEQWLDYGGEPMPCYPAKDVDEAIAELKAENESLKLAQRWIKVSDELPTDETEVPVILSNDWRTTDYYEKDKGNWHYHGSYVAYWFNVPKKQD